MRVNKTTKKTISGHILQPWEDSDVYYEVIREFCDKNGDVFDYIPLQQTSSYELAESIAKRTPLTNQRDEQISVGKTNGRSLELLESWTIKSI